ncbi:MULTISPECIES: glutathione peroxidase [unclassified Microbacterium]|uniref:glutathione peroxidase n=1 Tax=unclassified Microbacterium TaxID=2609290 RepID=UPI00214C874C|nr:MULTISPECIES: glutathione peroxidase [unclassified Microbacterium]MCR2785582.1 glutathione peroxidase [Microbacterium sp. zg.B96]MDL5350296.1 glutathione peroxidase [Microbacterium sp. zg-YB36]WIM17432.1 glutathione peroxidase [Microbacterium sp. zg-B96]
MADEQTVDIRQIPFRTPEGEEKTLAELGDGPVLVVNVASKCGLTPQYEQLEQLQRTYGERGLTVVGFPSNQFMGQEPGSMDEILEYCSTTWGVTFPVEEKVHVNGRNAAPLYKALKKARNPEGAKGPVMWNFEKFLVTPSGQVHRFRPQTKPDAPEVIEAIEAALPR